jgi:hypothetical protein
MAVRSLVRAISRFGLDVRRRFLERGGIILVREQRRDGSLEIVRPYRVSDMRWGVEVESYADVRHLLVGEEGEIGPFESDCFSIIWKD